MATRPFYRPLGKFVGFKTVDSAPFEWHGGFAFSQKQKNVGGKIELGETPDEIIAGMNGGLK